MKTIQAILSLKIMKKFIYTTCLIKKAYTTLRITKKDFGKHL